MTHEGKAKHAPRTGARCVVDGLIKAGCDTLFGYPGGTVLDIFNCLYDAPVHFVLSRHEQGSVHEADGYARATGKVGCCLVTSGPGATNTVTGLATAYMDGIPLVCISGQVPLSMIGNDAFQEADTTGITRAVTKHNYLVRNVDDIPKILAEAFFIASTGKPGPVLVDIPKDIQRQSTHAETPETVSVRAYEPFVEPDLQQVKVLADAVNKAQRPLLYVGGGIFPSNACEALTRLARELEIPVTTTLMGLGAFPETEPLALGMVGMHGSVASNNAVCQCDLIISAGARFDDRVTGKVSEFARSATVAHIDIDRSAIGKSVRVDIPVVGDLRATLEALRPLLVKTDRAPWLAQVKEWLSSYPPSYPKRADGLLQPQKVIELIDAASKGQAVIVTDVGQHQMWAAQFYTYTQPRSFISSGGLGTMGFGLPAAIGAQMARPDALVVCVTGDGGVQMNFQELVVAVEHKLPVNIVILNNGHLGMVRQWQELFYSERYSAVILGQTKRPVNERIGDAEKPRYLPDFIGMAEAHGARARRVTTAEETQAALAEAFASPETWVIECIVAPDENVFPMVPPGASLAEMLIQTTEA